jgi:hypothetical protein
MSRLTESHNQAPPDPAARPSAVQRRGMRLAIIQASLAATPALAFTNGFILLYLTAQHIADERIVLYLALPALGGCVMLLPCAYFCDRFGKKRGGIIGCIM